MKAYELYEYSNYIGTYTPKEIEEKIGMRRRVVCDYAANGMQFNKKYAVYPASAENERLEFIRKRGKTLGWSINDDSSGLMAWCDKWDKARMETRKQFGWS